MDHIECYNYILYENLAVDFKLMLLYHDENRRNLYTAKINMFTIKQYFDFRQVNSMY